ncbi:MAG: NAD(P)/FAD-dependent oxidoreductase [Planctomycetes bacterium]|nr:NAD(P)/FAD-dependent oxidoreductase [Planctomycetota bacterium]
METQRGFPHRVVIIGGGFGGLYAAKELADTAFQVTLIDRRNFHLFQPLLYQVATGALSPADIASPLREILKRQRNVQVLLAEAVDFEPGRRAVILGDGEISYDSLIVAAGMQNHYFGHDDWRPFAPALKGVEDATEIRRRLLFAFEAAEREADPAKRAPWLTFTVVGGGPTGVELAGALAELARDTLRKDFRAIDPAESRIILLEGGDRILQAFSPCLSRQAEKALARLGVGVRPDVKVTRLSGGEVECISAGTAESIRSKTILWAAGVKASPLGEALARRTGAAADPQGRVLVTPWLHLRSHPEIFVIGDLAHCAGADGRPLPGLAPVAIQQGQYAARLLKARLEGWTPAPFAYRDWGNLATIGRAAAVAEIGKLEFSGFFAWLLWLFVHLVQLIGFENRLLVLIQWAWNYFTWNRSARLITGEVPSRREKGD